MSHLISLSVRSVRTIAGPEFYKTGMVNKKRTVYLPRLTRHHAPWPQMKLKTGIQKVGARWDEKKEWPGASDGPMEWVEHRVHHYSELSPKFEDTDQPQHRDHTNVQTEGYTHPVTGEFIRVADMRIEIVMPRGLGASSYKPYVSYRTDAKIDADLALAEKDRELGWPPLKCTAKLLFDMHYKDNAMDRQGIEAETPAAIDDTVDTLKLK